MRTLLPAQNRPHQGAYRAFGCALPEHTFKFLHLHVKRTPTFHRAGKEHPNPKSALGVHCGRAVICTLLKIKIKIQSKAASEAKAVKIQPELAECEFHRCILQPTLGLAQLDSLAIKSGYRR